MPETPPPILDSMSAPAPPPQAPKRTADPQIFGDLSPEQKKSAGALRVFVLILLALYIIGALVLLAIFPTTNTSLWWLKGIGTLGYMVGAALWLGIGLFAANRVAAYNKTANKKVLMMSLARIFALVVPALMASAAVLLMINGEPSLPIDVIAPTRGELVAPISITFGTETAKRVFDQTNLSPVSYSWDFDGDGTYDQLSTESQITKEYERSGAFTVRAEVKMTNGETRILSRRIFISKEVFSVKPENPIIDEPVTLSLAHLFDDPKQFVRAQWDFEGDGNIDVETDLMDVVYTYRRLGEFEPKVTVTYATNVKTDIARKVLVKEPTPLPFPVAIRTLPPTLLGTAPFGVLFNIETTEPIASVDWTFGSGEGTANGLITPHVFSRVGNFSVTASVRSLSGTIAKVTRLVQVTQPLKLADLRFTGTPEVRNFVIQGEQPLTVNITPETSQPLVTFSWDAPDASEVYSTEKTLNAIFRKVGEWEVDLIGVDAEQKVLRQTITVKVTPPKSDVSIVIDPPTPVAPALVKFDASDTFIPGKQITGYEWDFGDNVKRPLGALTEHTYEKSGTYNIRLRVKTLDGGLYDASKVLVVRAPLLDACFLPSRTSGTAPLGVRFDTSCSTAGFTGWEWDFGDNSQSAEQNPVHVFKEPGIYTVKLRAKDSEGKIVEKQVMITVSSVSQ